MSTTSQKFSYRGRNGAIIDLGKVKNDSIETFSFDQSNIPDTSDWYDAPGGQRSAALGFSFETEEPLQNIFVRLSNLKTDLDLYLGQIDPESNQPIVPANILYSRSSTRRGYQDESVFQALPKGKYYIEVANNVENYDIDQFDIEINSKTFDQTTSLPDDPLLSAQWHLFNNGTGISESLIGRQPGGIAANVDILAPEAWKINNDASNVIVAVVDSGVAVNHPDLKKNIWVNDDEIPDNGVDDDNNGYIDDIHGWNFEQNNNDPSPNVINSSHGTHVAGIIGARGNNGIGVAGVAWNAKIMAVNASSGESVGYGYPGIEYAVNNGARVINVSWGTDIKVHPDRLMDYTDNSGNLVKDLPRDLETIRPIYTGIYNVLKAAHNKDVMINVSAGNSGRYDTGLNEWKDIGNRDSTLDYLNFFNRFFDNIVVVGALNAQDRQSIYSSYGNSVDISAPGGDTTLARDLGILSTVADFENVVPASDFTGADGESLGFIEGQAKYAYFQGTSMSAPVVSGAAALLRSTNPELTAGEIKHILINSADKNTRLAGIAGEQGLTLNLLNALELANKVGNGEVTLSNYSKTIRADQRKVGSLIGDEASERIIGSRRSDVIVGNGGNDLLRGSRGKDILIGGDGADLLVGGQGIDIYSYSDAKESMPSRSDQIEFNRGDKVDISGLAHSLAPGIKFTFVEDNDFSGIPGEVRVTPHGLSADFDGDLVPDFRVAFQKPLGFSVQSSDLILA